MLTQIWRIVLASVAKQSRYFFRIASLRSQGRQHKINLTLFYFSCILEKSKASGNIKKNENFSFLYI